MPGLARIRQNRKVVFVRGHVGKRVGHITEFLKAVGIMRAQFAGNSMGGTMLLTVAAVQNVPWPIDRMVIVSGRWQHPGQCGQAIAQRLRLYT